jgi:SAM-dependent methyltransferase
MSTQSTGPLQDILADFHRDAFGLRRHLIDHLGVGPDALEEHLARAQEALRELGEGAFSWEDPEAFYSSAVQAEYLFELAAWHEGSSGYIGDSLALVGDWSRGTVLDFGAGIGTHAIAAARLPAVERVDSVDLNPVNRAFVEHRAQALGLDTIQVLAAPRPVAYDTILCFDVLEHLADPVAQLRQFSEALAPEGVLLCNWYFSRGFQGEYPFHLEDPTIIRSFFLHLQANFLEQFHPHLITTRCYRLHPERLRQGGRRWLEVADPTP